MLIELGKLDNIAEQDFQACETIIPSLKANKENKLEWLVESTEVWCQEKAIHNALYESIMILQDKTGKLSKGSIPQVLSEALAVSFDTHIGHDYIDDAEKRFEYYHTKQKKIPFDLDMMNLVTNGGVSPKTLNILMGGINVGKTQAMCHFASANLLDGLNVLYITNEMAEEEISRRIDANLLNVPMDQIEDLTKPLFDEKINKIRLKGNGKLIIKEYPTATASAVNFKHLLIELKIKLNFVPDIIYIDYLNICASSRIKNRETTYSYMKSVAEELRGLAVEFKLPIWMAIQFNREGMFSSDPDMDDSAESIGIPATADFMVAMVSNEELEELGQLMFKQLKNRYRDKTKNRRFIIGNDKSKMRLFDAEEQASKDLSGNEEPEDKGTGGVNLEKFKGAQLAKTFAGFK